MIKLLNAKQVDEFQLKLEFSDHSSGIFDAQEYFAQRTGLLLDFVREAKHFNRFFIDAGALCWPNGLKLPAGRLREICRAVA
jgi:hypothetical protein